MGSDRGWDEYPRCGSSGSRHQERAVRHVAGVDLLGVRRLEGHPDDAVVTADEVDGHVGRLREQRNPLPLGDRLVPLERHEDGELAVAVVPHLATELHGCCCPGERVLLDEGDDRLDEDAVHRRVSRVVAHKVFPS